MPRPPSDSVQIAIRVPADWLKEAEEVAALLSKPGFQASRTDAFRAAMARGFEVLKAELSPPPEAPVNIRSRKRTLQKA